MNQWVIIFSIAGIFVVIGVILYNSMARLKVRVENAWSQISVQLKRRHDLIPNLVETVKGYAAHEKQTLENVTNARAKAVSAQGVAEQAKAENVLTSALRQLFAVAENYPNLKANQNFLALHEELTTTENRIAFARQFFNDETALYNTALITVPRNIVAGLLGFKRVEFLQIENPAEGQPPQVKF